MSDPNQPDQSENSSPPDDSSSPESPDSLSDTAAADPPRPGGSKLFPQLPDDPRLVEAQERERTEAAEAQASAEAAAMAAASSTAQAPGEDPDVTTVMSQTEIQETFGSSAAEVSSPNTTPAAEQAGAIQAGAEQTATGQPESGTGAIPGDPTQQENWQSWGDLNTPAQWREGSQDFQDPISEDVSDERSVQLTADISAESGGRNIFLAIAVGVMLGAVFFGALSAGRAVVVVLAALLLVLAIAEFFGVARTVGYRPATLFGVASVAALTGAVYWRGFEAYPLVIALIAVAGLVWFLLGVESEHPTANFAITTMGIAWIGGLGSFVALMLRTDHGDAVLIAAVVGTVTYDVLGYIIGSTTGQTRLAYRISPNKTIEGLIGGVVLSVLVTSVVLYRFPGIYPFTDEVLDAVWLGAVIALAAPLGDLCQSLIKRDLQVKDMGTLLPGHGGVLDRFDALLFALPAAYYVSEYVLG